MASEQKIIPVGEAQETPQAITITIVDPSALGNASIDSSLVASVETQDSSDPSSIVMVTDGERDSKDILQTVTETHMGTEDLPIISSISNPEEEDDETVVHETKLSEGFDGGGDETEADTGEPYEYTGPHCLICNIDLTSNESEEQILVFKTQTTATQRRVAVFLSSLIGQKLTSRKAHSDILCRRCFNLLDRVDSLEVEIQETKDEIVNKYQETVSAYGGRARRRKPATAKKTDYVFPKVEPEDEEDQLLDMELDSNFEPQVEDLMEEDTGIQDEEWEPEFKKPRIKRENTDISDTGGPPKRKRGRPRKDAAKSKGAADSTASQPQDSCGTSGSSNLQTCKDSMVEEGKDNSPAMAATNRLPVMSAATAGTPDDCIVSSSLAQQCPVCFITYFTISDLRNHFRQIHSDVKIVKCIQCNTMLPANFKVFLAHCKGHQCVRKAMAGCDSNMRECSVCHKQVTASGYSHHLASHKTVSCPKCNLKVGWRNLKRHISYSHDKHCLFPCVECSIVYYDASSLASHRKRNHMGQEVRRHLCEVCGKKFITPYDLRRHVACVHQNVRKFVCEYCGLRFKTSSALMYHRRRHTGEKPHMCHVCERSFMKPSALAKHVRRVHGLEYQGKYRKRRKTTLLPPKRTQDQEASDVNVAVKHEDVPGSSLPKEQRGASDTTHSKEEEQEEANGEGLRVSAGYSLAERNIVQVVNPHSSQPLQNLAYFRPVIQDRTVARPCEAGTPIHAISYYRDDTEGQYTVAELLPSQTLPNPIPATTHSVESSSTP